MVVRNWWQKLVVFLSVVYAGASAFGAQTKIGLVLSADSAKPGDTVMAGITMEIPEGWHSFWQNPGGPGLPTTVAWSLPKGISAGDMLWPLPTKEEVFGEPSYVYSGKIMLLVPLKIDPGLPAGEVEIKADVAWQECQTLCVQGQQDVTAKLVLGAATVPSGNAPIIDAAKARIPQVSKAVAVTATWEKAAEKRGLILEWATTNRNAELDFFPYASTNYTVEGETKKLPDDGMGIRIRKLVTKSDTDWPGQIAGVLVTKSTSNAAPEGVEITLSLGARNSANSSSAPAAAVTGDRTPGTASLWQMLIYAFVGGLILNLMPCVLPVIALKILGFVNQASQERGQIRKLGLIYCLGVLVSFLALAGAVIAVKAVGHAASWGMQFQNPQFLLGMTVLVTLVALNLFGLFEITLSGSVMGAAGNLSAKEGNSGAFFNGVLATILATPCTAPFLGAALGFAFTQSSATVVLIFLTVGLGLALPYVVLSWHPAWLKFLPKPGAWMEKFKIVMGFPMLATAFWLFTLSASAFGDSSEFLLGLFLIIVALVAWIWGQFVQRGRSGKALAVVVCVALFGGAYCLILERELHWRTSTPGSGSVPILSAADGMKWEPWSPDAITVSRASGRPILVDFTAKWCATCNLNNKPALESAAVRAKLKQINAITLIENSFTKNATVVAELNRYQRAGVPLVLVYPADPKAPPEVLPELLTEGIVLDALNRASTKPAPGPSALNR